MKMWSVKRIDEIGKIITGKTPSSNYPDEFGLKYPFITPSDIPNTQKHISVERFLSEKGMESHKRIKLPPKTICVVCIGATIGKVCTTTVYSFSNQQINNIIPNKENDPDFVYYLASTLKDALVSFAGGAATPIVNKSVFSLIKVLVPVKDCQRKISAILSAYDELIENNNRRIAILENMAEEIYREWFVRMRFPGHEKVKVVKGVPEGWEIKKIGDICSKITDGSHLSPEYFLNGKPMASVKDMNSYGFSLDNIKTISEKDFEKLKKADCKPITNDILIAKDGSYLKHVFVWDYDIDIVILSSIAILRPDTNIIKPYFLSHTLKQDSTKAMMAGFVSGSALPRIILNDFKKMKLLIPTSDIIDDFDSLVNPLYQSIKVKLLTNSKLKKSRDLLLPRLISGKLDVEKLDIAFPPGMQSHDPTEGKEAEAA